MIEYLLHLPAPKPVVGRVRSGMESAVETTPFMYIEARRNHQGHNQAGKTRPEVSFFKAGRCQMGPETISVWKAEKAEASPTTGRNLEKTRARTNNFLEREEGARQCLMGDTRDEFFLTYGLDVAPWKLWRKAPPLKSGGWPQYIYLPIVNPKCDPQTRPKTFIFDIGTK